MYVKCKYQKGMWPHEDFADLSDYLKDDVRYHPFFGCFVNKEDIVPLDAENGLVKVRGYEIREDKALVGINDTGDHRVSRFVVPASSLVESVIEALKS